jgi:hypothetical protein
LKIKNAFISINGGKTSSFDYHRRFLSSDYKYRKNIKDFFVGRVERDVAPLLPSGEELYNMVSKYEDIIFGFHSGN